MAPTGDRAVFKRCPNIPDTSPPDVSEAPVCASVLRLFIPPGRGETLLTTWPMAPKTTGMARVQASLTLTLDFIRISTVSPANRKAGGVRKYPNPIRPPKRALYQSMRKPFKLNIERAPTKARNRYKAARMARHFVLLRRRADDLELPLRPCCGDVRVLPGLFFGAGDGA